MEKLDLCLYKIDGIRFKAYEPPMAGDYIVYLNNNDVYHCSEKVFKERNVVPKVKTKKKAKEPLLKTAEIVNGEEPKEKE